MNAAQNNTPPVGAGCLKGTSQSHPPDTGTGLAIARCGTSLADGGDPTPRNFDCLPAELTSRARWVLWRDGKVPHCAARPHRRASCTKPDTWASFEAARAAYVPGRDRGLGFVLGDGIAGVDIDHDTSEAAQFLLETVGCGYVEASPSGGGLHGWAFSRDKLPRCKGVLDGMHVEVYNRDRYFTVTGDAITSAPLVHTDRILRLSLALQREAALSGSADPANSPPSFTEHSEHTEHSDSVKEEEANGEISAAVRRHLPTGPGQRNRMIFELARELRHLRPDTPARDFRRTIEMWHALALPKIRTKDFSATWTEFMAAHANVRIDTVAGIAGVADDLDAEPLPDAAIARYSPDELKILRLCVRLQRATPHAPFFLACRTAEQLTGINYRTCSNILRSLRMEGVLIVFAEHTRTTATRYYVAPEFLASNCAHLMARHATA